MFNPNLSKWENRFLRRLEQKQWATPIVEDELINYQHLLSGQGLALDLACGVGTHALYFATLGYHVIACDAAFNGVKICNMSATKHGLPLSPVVFDLRQPAINTSNIFSLITVTRYLHKDLFAMIKKWLVPGGLVFYKTFNPNHLIQHPNFNPQYILQWNQLQQAFSDFEIIAHHPGRDDSNFSHILARKRQ